MSDFDSGTSSRSRRTVLILSLVVIAALAAGTWYLLPRFEREAPQIRLSPDTDVLGLGSMEIVVSDRGAGLKSVTATLSSGNSEQSLAAEQYPQPVSEQKITVSASKLKGVKEGPAVLRVTARDSSLW